LWNEEENNNSTMVGNNPYNHQLFGNCFFSSFDSWLQLVFLDTFEFSCHCFSNQKSPQEKLHLITNSIYLPIDFTLHYLPF